MRVQTLIKIVSVGSWGPGLEAPHEVTHAARVLSRANRSAGKRAILFPATQAVRPQAKRSGLEHVAHAMVHCKRVGEVDLGVNKDECCGKHHQNRGTDLENERGARSRWPLSPRGNGGLLNGSSKQKRRAVRLRLGS